MYDKRYKMSVSIRKEMYIVIIFSIFTKITTALNNGLALTPPMGWMHWQRYRCVTDCDNYPDDCVQESLFRDMADHMVSEGYLDAGYNYIIIDDCWSQKERDENNKLQPDPKRFPNGIKALSDYIHNKGLKFGIYADFGTKTCAGYPGSIDYLEIDANTFAEWGVDYLKLDGCYSNITEQEQGYKEMGIFLNRTGRPIVYSCSYPAYQEPKNIQPDYNILMENCNLWRNWDDIDDSWQSVIKILKWFSDNQDRIANFSGPGHWNDPDMLILGNYGLSYEQNKAQMAIWAIMAAPLIMSVDLKTIEPKYRDILLNKNILKINQDPLGIQGKLIKTIKKIDIWMRPMMPIINNQHSYAIGFLSQRVDGYPFRLNLTLNKLNLTNTAGYEIKNIFDNEENIIKQLHDDIVIRIKPTGIVLLLATPLN